MRKYLIPLGVCSGPCLNGGSCIGGGCECRPGYTGHYCQRDLDECASGLHSCSNSSMRCVNMPGWYYCTCAQGYVSALAYHQASITAICQGTILLTLYGCSVLKSQLFKNF